MKVNKNGFTLVEVMIAIAIMSGMIMVMIKIFESQTQSFKNLEFKQAIREDYSTIVQLFQNAQSCKETFQSFNIQSLSVPADADIAQIELKQIHRMITKTDGTFLKKTIQVNSYKNIQKIILEIASSDIENLKDILQLKSTLKIYFKKKKFINRQYTKSINITHYFQLSDHVNLKLSHCTSNTLSNSKKSLLPIGHLQNPGLINKSGNYACKSKGLSCAWVQSTNFVFEANGMESIGFVCQSSYNKSLVGVMTGSPIANIHSCDAKIGKFVTFKKSTIDFNVTCKGVFYAICN